MIFFKKNSPLMCSSATGFPSELFPIHPFGLCSSGKSGTPKSIYLGFFFFFHLPKKSEQILPSLICSIWLNCSPFLRPMRLLHSCCYRALPLCEESQTSGLTICSIISGWVPLKIHRVKNRLNLSLGSWSYIILNLIFPSLRNTSLTLLNNNKISEAN